MKRDFRVRDFWVHVAVHQRDLDAPADEKCVLGVRVASFQPDLVSPVAGVCTSANEHIGVVGADQRYHGRVTIQSGNNSERRIVAIERVVFKVIQQKSIVGMADEVAWVVDGLETNITLSSVVRGGNNEGSVLAKKVAVSGAFSLVRSVCPKLVVGMS